MPAYSSSSIEKIYLDLEEQQRIAGQLIRYLQERLAPFQRHVAEHRRHIDQALKHLDSRLVPLRQYVQGEHQNLNRVTAHLDSGLRDQFEAFDQVLAHQKGIVEAASHYIAEQPRPLQTYLEDERQAVDMIYRDLEQRLDRFLRNLLEQQEILESIRKPEVVSEYNALAQYLEERQRALERYSSSAEHRPAELLAQLDEIAERYKPGDPRAGELFMKVFEEMCLADENLRQAVSVPVASPPTHPDIPESASVVVLPPQELKVLD